MDVSALDPRHLSALVAVAETGTFGRAAAQLGYSQSAVSQQIAALEQALGASVFDRPGGPRPVELTPMGAIVLAQARRVLAVLADAAAEIARFEGGETGPLSVGTFQSASTAILPGVVAAMREAAPGVQIELQESDDDADLFAALDDGTLDVSFVVGELPATVSSTALLSDPFVLVAPAGMYPPGPVDLVEAAARPLIGQPLDSSCQRLGEGALRALVADPHYVFRTADNGAVAAMVRAGMGVAVLPLLCVDPDDDTIAVHALEPQLPSRSVHIAWRTDRSLPPSAHRFVELSSQVAADVADALRQRIPHAVSVR
ncbi:MAG: LysR family transcriptional regulator [Actinomycetota bacterium]